MFIPGKMKKCNLCGKTAGIAYRLKDETILKCSNCGLLFTDADSIKSDKKNEMYEKDYFTTTHPNFFKECSRDYPKFMKKSSKLRRFHNTLLLLKKFKPGGSILDIGCATGVFLDMAKKEGYRPQGLDISKYASEYAKKNFGIEVFTGYLEKAPFPKKRFDIITMWDFIEHVNDPKATLKKAASLVKDDGLIFILTTNEDSLMCWLADLAYKCSFGMIKKPVELVHPVHHITHFSENTLIRMLHEAGLKPIYRKKSEMPLQNVEGNIIIKATVAMLYAFAWIIRKPHEIQVIARKNESE